MNLKNLLKETRLYKLIVTSSSMAFIMHLWHRIQFAVNKPIDLKLHLGCGNIRKPEYINIDHRKTIATDFVCDIKKLPFPANSVELIESYHVIEHIPHPQVPKMLKEWLRVLKHEGKLVIECPDFDKAVKEYLAGNEKRVYNIFGLQRFPGDTHLFGYNHKRLSSILFNAGFIKITSSEPTDYHKREEPCMRVECHKQ